MNRIFDSHFSTATSQDVESYFKTLKYHILDQKMVRANKFMQLHIQSLKTEFKLRLAEGIEARRSDRSAASINEGISALFIVLCATMN